MTDEWLVTRDGKTKHGPFSMAKLKELADFGKLAPTDMVLQTGAAKWIRAASVDGLFGFEAPRKEEPPAPIPMAVPVVMVPPLPSTSPGMYHQRILVLVAAAIGMLATFLPWVNVPIIGSISGTSGDGWITFALFVAVIVAAICGAPQQPLGRVARLAVAIPATIAAMIGVLDMIHVNERLSDVRHDNPFAGLVQIGIGLYVLIAAGGMVVLFALWPAPEKKSTR